MEANPRLADGIRERFSSFISSGQLAVVSAAIVGGTTNDKRVPFYISKRASELSQLSKSENQNDFEEIEVPAISVIELIRKFGDPFFVKIDVEHYDHEILKELFRNQIYPTYLSAESHSTCVIGHLLASGQYSAFQLAEGLPLYKVPMASGEFGSRTGVPSSFSLPAGPFGKDLSGKWYTGEDILVLLEMSGMGWKDIHVSKLDLARKLTFAGKFSLVCTLALNKLRARFLKSWSK